MTFSFSFPNQRDALKKYFPTKTFSFLRLEFFSTKSFFPFVVDDAGDVPEDSNHEELADVRRQISDS